MLLLFLYAQQTEKYNWFSTCDHFRSHRSTTPLSLQLNPNVVLFLSSSDLLKGVLEQSLPGYRNLYMAGQSVGLDRDKNEKVQFLIQKTSLSLENKKS